ncbi:MAG: hypothetical protein LCH90_22295, partial [Proteobacteria bacterium]|nr:hypothetical protein [Pseudomonadota bacterium]
QKKLKRIRVHVVRRGHEYAIWAARGRWGGRTLTGEPQHRDHYLSKTERASGKHIMPCVSRARAGGLLVLDL